MQQHPADDRLIEIWRLLCEHIATDADRSQISEPLKRNVLWALREAWDQGWAAAHEDDTRQVALPGDEIRTDSDTRELRPR